MYQLIPANTSHLLSLFGWITNSKQCNLWAGPALSYPFSFDKLQQLLINQDSFALIQSEKLMGIGQIIYDKQRVHFARIIVNPTLRQQGNGLKLMLALIHKSKQLYDIKKYSLFVYAENIAAIRLYAKLGFEFSPFTESALPHNYCYMEFDQLSTVDCD